MLALLEVGIGKTEEDLGELALLEVVGEELHGVGAESRDVLVGSNLVRFAGGVSLALVLRPKSVDTAGHIVEDLRSQFHS